MGVDSDDTINPIFGYLKNPVNEGNVEKPPPINEVSVFNFGQGAFVNNPSGFQSREPFKPPLSIANSSVSENYTTDGVSIDNNTIDKGRSDLNLNTTDEYLIILEGSDGLKDDTNTSLSEIDLTSFNNSDGANDFSNNESMPENNNLLNEIFDLEDLFSGFGAPPSGLSSSDSNRGFQPSLILNDKEVLNISKPNVETNNSQIEPVGSISGNTIGNDSDIFNILKIENKTSNEHPKDYSNFEMISTSNNNSLTVNDILDLTATENQKIENGENHSGVRPIQDINDNDSNDDTKLDQICMIPSIAMANQTAHDNSEQIEDFLSNHDMTTFLSLLKQTKLIQVLQAEGSK